MMVMVCRRQKMSVVMDNAMAMKLAILVPRIAAHVNLNLLVAIINAMAMKLAILALRIAAHVNLNLASGKVGKVGKVPILMVLGLGGNSSAWTSLKQY